MNDTQRIGGRPASRHGVKVVNANEPFRVFDADAGHVDFLSAFGRQSFIDAYRETLSLADLEAYCATAFSKQNILAEMSDASAMYFVCADPESNLCGYSKLIVSAPPGCGGTGASAELQRLYVVDRYRGRGIGRRLLAHSEVKAARNGFKTMWLRVWERNLVAQRMYSKTGYSIIGEEPYKVGKEFRRVLVMRKDLSAITHDAAGVR